VLLRTVILLSSLALNYVGLNAKGREEEEIDQMKFVFTIVY
jgi:hypothetical protein